MFTFLSFSSFIVISILFVAIPGPNVAVIISTTLSHDKKRGFATVAGTSSAMIVQLFVAAIATNWLLLFIADKLLWLKWIGVAYLAYLGILSLSQFHRKAQPEKISGAGSFSRGFWISLTNPKTILFFSAFLPQFVSSQNSYIEQITILSISFWLIALLIDSTYVLMADLVKTSFIKLDLTQTQQGISGALYLMSSTILALSHKSQ